MQCQNEKNVGADCVMHQAKYRPAFIKTAYTYAIAVVMVKHQQHCTY